mmetsp:Transcript_21847/g.47755  ORF Transcript_21847/g.47755 Transcript_21847/m.47755 type:complete len:375 (+) Transcript_21847:68-1192(+)
MVSAMGSPWRPQSRVAWSTSKRPNEQEGSAGVQQADEAGAACPWDAGFRHCQHRHVQARHEQDERRPARRRAEIIQPSLRHGGLHVLGRDFLPRRVLSQPPPPSEQVEEAVQRVGVRAAGVLRHHGHVDHVRRPLADDGVNLPDAARQRRPLHRLLLRPLPQAEAVGLPLDRPLHGVWRDDGRRRLKFSQRAERRRRRQRHRPAHHWRRAGRRRADLHRSPDGRRGEVRQRPRHARAARRRLRGILRHARAHTPPRSAAVCSEPERPPDRGLARCVCANTQRLEAADAAAAQLPLHRALQRLRDHHHQGLLRCLPNGAGLDAHVNGLGHRPCLRRRVLSLAASVWLCTPGRRHDAVQRGRAAAVQWTIPNGRTA